jgi:hypothetical protein
MIKKIFFTLAISLLFLGCSNNSEEKSTTQSDTISHAGHQHNDETESIALNNGEKWNVDAEMMVHIRNMENDISGFGGGDLKNYAALTEKLLVNVDLLTSNCTMKGQAHDELHKWLLPYIDLVNKLSETKEQSQAEKKFAELQSSYHTFNQYFK